MCKGEYTGIVSRALAYNSTLRKKKGKFLKPKKWSVNCTDSMERFGSYTTLNYFFFFQQLNVLTVFPKHSAKLFFVSSAPTHQKAAILKTPSGRKCFYN